MFDVVVGRFQTDDHRIEDFSQWPADGTVSTTQTHTHADGEWPIGDVGQLERQRHSHGVLHHRQASKAELEREVCTARLQGQFPVRQKFAPLAYKVSSRGS